MNTPQNDQSLKAESVYLNQKTGMKELHTLFGPQSLDTDSNSGLSKAMEISLYALFVSFILIMLLIPNQAERVQDMFPNIVLTDPVGFVLWIKMALFIASLVPLFWALHQSSKRLKGRLIARRARA